MILLKGNLGRDLSLENGSLNFNQVFQHLVRNPLKKLNYFKFL